MSFKKALEEAIHVKMELLNRNREQMRSDMDSGVLSSRTVGCLHTAQESFKAAKLHLDQDKAADAMYLFSRGCWNMGEVMGRSAFEKEIHNAIQREKEIHDKPIRDTN